MKHTSKPISKCQVCGNPKLKSVLFVGYIPPVNQMPSVDSVPEEHPSYPLEMLRCDQCTLVQIGCEVDAEILFPPEYPYLSGTTRILRENFAHMHQEVKPLLNLTAKDLVVDIGSNDGTLLSNFTAYQVLGIEPSRAADVANSKNIRTRMTFFNKKIAQETLAEFGHARLITATNVFAHIGDVHSIVDGITTLMDPKGIFINESHYLLDLVDTIQYDTLYHEHLRYYSLGALKYLLEGHGLEIFKVTRIPTHGGSIRVYSAKKGTFKVESNVTELLALEDKMGLTDGSCLKTFRQRVIQSKLDLMTLLSKIKRDGGRVYGIGAPSRASTLVKYTGLDDGTLDCVMEVKGSHKVGKYMPGTRIPVLEESKLFSDQPEYALFLSWHISKELAENLRKKGFKGKFITPLPKPEILAI